MYAELTEYQIEAFKGLDQSYKDMEEKLEQRAPRCHMRPMFLDEADVSDYRTEQWWECSVCGHTKPIN